MCKVSIVVPVHNAEHFIRETLSSILNQTYTDFECILVDDGSTDNTRQIIEQHIDPRLVYIWQPNSGGPAKPRNVGIQHAKGEYVFLFDADDLMSPVKLELSVKALDNTPQADFLCTNFSSVDEHGSLLNDNYLKAYEKLWAMMPASLEDSNAFLLESDKLYAALIYANFIGTSSVAFRKHALSSSDKFNEDLKNSDDRLFWILFSKAHNAVFLNVCLHFYRIQPNGITNQDFLRRGPSKIKALNIVYESCTDVKLKAVIKKQIATNYFSMAYSYKLKKLKNMQRESALKSLDAYFNFGALKLFLHSFM